MTLRSVRLALTPAAALLNYSLAFDNTKKLPLQKDLNEYLSSKPGQKAAVHGFVRYLREKCGAEIEIPNGNHAGELNLSCKVLNLSRKRLEVELLALMRLEAGCEDSNALWLATALSYFHGLKPSRVKEIMKTGFSVTQGGVVFTWKGMEYWLPIPHWWNCKEA